MIYESGEDYLETIFLLRQKKDPVRPVDIAKELGFSKPSITRAMNRLEETGHVIRQDGHILLTPAGEARAREVYRRHLLLRSFLISIGVSWETAEKDACRMEHVISEESLLCLKEYMKEVEKP